jgi:predicted Zn-dependent protease
MMKESNIFMVFKILKKYTVIYLIFFLFILIIPATESVYAQSGYNGRPYFEEAYRLETSDPLKSAELYKKAMQYGLDDKMKSAAVWRVFHLYKSQKRYASAYLMLPRLPSGQGIGKVQSDLSQDMMYAWKIDSGILDIYLRGINALASKNGNSDYRSHFLSAVSRTPGNAVFHKEISDRLIESGRQEEAFSIIRQSDQNAPAAALLEADYLISQDRLNEAEILLNKISVGTDKGISSADRFQLLYLLAKIEKEKNNTYESIVYYRLAAQYAQAEEQNRQISLAAFSIYKAGYPSQAYALIYRLPESSDFNMNLLSLVLRVYVAGDQAAVNRLISMEKELKAQRNKSGPSFLVDNALQLIGKRSQQ